MSASMISAALAAQKYWSASLYSQASRAMLAYSHRLSKPIGEWANQDTAHATSLQQVSHTLAKKDGVEEAFCVIPTSIAPLAVSAIKAPKPDAAEDAALAILTALAAAECHHARVFADAARRPEARDLFQILDLEVLSAVSAAREQAALEMIDQIRTGRLWTSEAPTFWRCLQCGGRYHGKSALEQCPCCKANRSYATAGGW